MTQIKTNKSVLSQEQKKLKNYKQFLPALELKRLKLLVEKNKAKIELEKIIKDSNQEELRVSEKLPMVSDAEINLEGLVKIESTNIKNENIVGVRLPLITSIQFKIADYTYFNTPH